MLVLRSVIITFVVSPLHDTFCKFRFIFRSHFMMPFVKCPPIFGQNICVMEFQLFFITAQVSWVVFSSRSNITLSFPFSGNQHVAVSFFSPFSYVTIILINFALKFHFINLLHCLVIMCLTYSSIAYGVVHVCVLLIFGVYDLQVYLRFWVEAKGKVWLIMKGAAILCYWTGETWSPSRHIRRH